MSDYYAESYENTSRQFLITGHPRSGTQYTARCLQVMSWSISTEAIYPHVDGVVSWKHAPMGKRFRTVLHQTRHPIDVINSSTTISDDELGSVMLKHIGELPQNSLERNIRSYLNWNTMIEGFASCRYAVERLGEVYEGVFAAIGLPAPSSWTNLVPTDQNTRRPLKLFDWNDIKGYNKVLYDELRIMAERYGYVD